MECLLVDLAISFCRSATWKMHASGGTDTGRYLAIAAALLAERSAGRPAPPAAIAVASEPRTQFVLRNS